MKKTIYWFRNDLRLYDNAAFRHACTAADTLIPVYIHLVPDTLSIWGFPRIGSHRQQFIAATLGDLRAKLTAKESGLIERSGDAVQLLLELARLTGANRIICEEIAAPEEQAQIKSLRAAGIMVETVWQSSLLDPAALPFQVKNLPVTFTGFRQAVEKIGLTPGAPQPCPESIPPFPTALPTKDRTVPGHSTSRHPDQRSSFPYHTADFSGGETAAQAHLLQYFKSELAHSYKQTRNGLSGTDFSSKFSPWLATGAVSARCAYAALKQFELEHGANDSSYWLWFELLWRDYFRLLHLQHGKQLYRANGLMPLRQLTGTTLPPTLSTLPTLQISHDPEQFSRWCKGQTGIALVDAGMRELVSTGYLSNRLRQIVASYLIHDLACDWRAGAAWFETQLIDYDVYSNQGNWLYLAGRGTDPRGGRRFDPQKQSQEYDRTGHYRQLWNTPSGT